MARSATKQEALDAVEEFKNTIYVNDQCPEWLKKIWVEDDDHGHMISIKATKEGRPPIPGIFKGIKVCIYSA